MNKLFFIPFLVIAFTVTSCITDDEANNVHPTPCQVAVITSESARVDFENTAAEDYTATCNDYKTALQQEITVCGDPDGSIQSTIDGLGDCTDPDVNEVNGQISVTAGTLDIVFDEIVILKVGSTLQVSGETSNANNYSIYFEVEENTEGEDVLQNFELTLISSYFPVVSSFTNTVDVNTTSTLTGTFSGDVENNDGGQLSLTNGTFDLNY